MPARDERRSGRDACGNRVRFAFDVGIRDNAIDEPLGQRFLRVEHAAFEQNFEGDRAPDEREQALQFAVGHGEAEVLDRHAEAAGFAADAHVAHRRDLKPATDAGALDHGDYGMPAARNGLHRGVDHRAVGFGVLAVGAFSREFGNIRAGGKRLVARAAQYDAAQFIVVRQFAHGGAERFPHRPVKRVEPGGIIERNGGNVPVARHHDPLHVARVSQCATPRP